jgi:deoxycytidylate deaminase/dephospho-CoA kinase
MHLAVNFPTTCNVTQKKDLSMSNESNALKRVYAESSEFIILGLTGRTGSGCSTAARILSKEKIHIPKVSKIYSTTNDKKKYEIARNYIKENWRPFISIQMRVIITGILLELNFKEFSALTSSIIGMKEAEVEKKLSPYKNKYKKAHKLITSYKEMSRKKKKKKAWSIYFEFLPNFCDTLKTTLQDTLRVDSYTALYQKVGDNIRASGVANDEAFNADKIFTLPKIVNKLIKVIRRRNNNLAFVTIDAIRNPFEAYYFHQRYSGFYLLSVNTPNEERLKHLRESHKFSEQQISALDRKEYPECLSGENVFISQNIQRCIELSDIHLNNPERQKFNNNELSSQLFWYVSLILHPGLVTPTTIERGMQLAFSAKLNSGCVSRQVGAVVTDPHYSVKAIGWNSTPEGQTPCLLRSASELLDGGEEEVYSRYERTNEEFQKVMSCTFSKVVGSNHLKGRNISYCFRDIQNKVDGEKNQVHTRSLHAEENAFLQIAKYGGEAIQDGFLFTTASPCELCSKKAYQLGIKKVIFIDPYPGISKEHILSSGSNFPDLVLFRGAIGHAYHRLYQPLLAYKDELQMLLGYKIESDRRTKTENKDTHSK